MECRTPHSHSSNSNPQTKTLLQNPANHINQTTQEKAMENFQEAIFKLVESQPNAPLTPARRTLLQDRLNQFGSEYKTPDHPPYSAMIERALRELNKKGGSNEDSISQFLKKEYENLPWAHSVLLKHHLSKLCDSGDIVITRNKKYTLTGENPVLNPSPKVKRKPKKRKCKWDWERERNRRGRKHFKKTKGSKVGVLIKHQEANKKEQNITKEEPKAETSGPHAEKREMSDSSPERPPGFEFVRIENLPNLDSKELEIASGQEFTKSNRSLRQKRRWSMKFPESSIKSEASPKTEEETEFPFLNEHKPQEQTLKSRRVRPKNSKFVNIMRLRNRRLDERPKRFNKKQELIKLDSSDEAEHEFEVKQLPKRVRPKKGSRSILKLEKDGTDSEDDEESKEDCVSLCERLEALRTEERPRKRRLGRPPKKRSLRLQKME